MGRWRRADLRAKPNHVGCPTTMNDSLERAGNRALLAVRTARQLSDPFDLLPEIEDCTERLMKELDSAEVDKEQVHETCRALGRCVTDRTTFMESYAGRSVADLSNDIALKFGWHHSTKRR